VSQENSIRMAAMCCLTVGGAAWRCKVSIYAATVMGSMSFEVLITGTISPGQELLDCPVIGSSCVSVPDRDRKKLEEFFPG